MVSVAEYYEGKNIFITGGSGFLGKVIIEKILRSCPRVGYIYVLLRSKKGKSIQDRLSNITETALFDVLKKSDPDALNKLIPIYGDVAELRLGMSEEDRQLIINNVHIIIHTAASVRFDDSLKYALILNVRGTRETVQLAIDTKNLSVFVHISTTFCNSDKTVIEEKIYPPHADWRDSIEMAETLEDNVLNALATKYIYPLPNTYTFAKSLSEHTVNDMCQGKVSAIIVRPSVVVPTIEDPFPGWVDNFNGPTGLLVAGGKGVLRTVLGHRNVIQDFIPADIIVRLIIVGIQQKALNGKKDEIEVYNGSKYEYTPVPVGEVVEMGAELVEDSPFSQILWSPNFSMTSCWYNYYIQVILFHMIPALFIDSLLKIAGKKPMIHGFRPMTRQQMYQTHFSRMLCFIGIITSWHPRMSDGLFYFLAPDEIFLQQKLFKTQRKIYIANVILEYFLKHSWKFVNTKALSLANHLTNEEKSIFGLDERYFNLTRAQRFDFFKQGKIGSALYILKEDFDFSRVKSRRNLFRLRILDRTVKMIFFGFVLWFFTVKFNVLNCIWNRLEHCIESIFN